MGNKRSIKFSNGNEVYFSDGQFDKFCVYVRKAGYEPHAPTDIEYFDRAHILALKHGIEQWYKDFCIIYSYVNKTIYEEVFNIISEISKKYNEDSVEMETLFATLYFAMVAEENKKYAILKKKIKRLGIHMLLMENCTSEYAANYSRGKDWKWIDNECKIRGF